MTLFRRWLERLLGLRSDVEDQLERSVRLNTAVAGAMAQAEACKEAEQYAAELEKTHPQLAAHLRHRIAEVVGTTTPTTPLALTAAPSPAPALPEAPPKPNGKPKKSTTPTPNPTPGE